MTAVDWTRYRQCEHCMAELGKPCMVLSGFRNGPIEVAAEQPHGGRKLRAASKGVDRG